MRSGAKITGRRAQRLRYRLLPTVLLAAAILVVPAVLYAWGRSSSSFAVREITVTGAERTSAGALIRHLRTSFVGGNLFTVAEAEVAEALASFPYVARVDVDRDFPSTLRVAVVEHQPVANVLATGGWYVVADDGYVVFRMGRDGTPAAVGTAATASAAPEPSISPSPAVSAAGAPGKSTGTQGLTSERRERLKVGPPRAAPRLPRFAVPGALTPGSYLRDPRTRAIFSALDALPAELQHRVGVVDASPEGQVSLRLAPRLEVVWGGGDRARAKAIALRTVLARYAAEGVSCTFVDVTIPDRVLARPILK